jgi:hypothetical protein
LSIVPLPFLNPACPSGNTPRSFISFISLSSTIIAYTLYAVLRSVIPCNCCLYPFLLSYIWGILSPPSTPGGSPLSSTLHSLSLTTYQRPFQFHISTIRSIYRPSPMPFSFSVFSVVALILLLLSLLFLPLCVVSFPFLVCFPHPPTTH